MRTLTPRAFRLALLVTALIGLVVRVEIGRKTFISFDEWQHVFMASSPRWDDLAFELRTNAHPPLFFLLLGGIVRLGNVALYRLISIAAGTASIVMAGLIARKALNSSPLQLACAAAFALSTAAISVSDEIRSYQLMILFVLVAFWAWLDLFPEAGQPVRAGSCIMFAICSSLAVLTHYAAAFFLGACVVVSGFVLVRFHRKPSLTALLALLFPCVVFAFEYVVHAGAQPMQGYLMDFYRSGTPGEPLTAFLLRNTKNFFNLFAPVEISATAACLIVVLAIGGGFVWALVKSKRLAPSAVLVFAAVISLELMAAGLMDKYPFGGMLRHQYIAGPFLLLAAFAMIDALPLPSPGFAVPLILIAASGVNLAANGSKLILYPGAVLVKDDFRSWRKTFPGPRAVYVDHWGVIAFFIHTSEQPRAFVRRIPDETVIDEYRMPDGTQIFYDKDRILLDFSDPAVYRSLASCLKATGIKELTVFFYSAGEKRVDDPAGALESKIRMKAAEQGLTATQVVLTHTSVAAAFQLQ